MDSSLCVGDIWDIVVAACGALEIRSGKKPAVHAPCRVVCSRSGMSNSAKWIFNLPLVKYFVETNSLLKE